MFKSEKEGEQTQDKRSTKLLLTRTVSMKKGA